MLDFYFKNEDTVINYGHSCIHAPRSMDFHLHDKFEIYYFISGNVNYFIEKKMYHLNNGDLLIMNNHEIHKPSFQSSCTYERIVIHFYPAVASVFSNSSYDVLHCFTSRPPGQRNLIRLNEVQKSEILEMFMKIEKLNKNLNNSSILKLTYFTELLVYINEVFKNSSYTEEHTKVPEKLLPVLDYIDANLEGDLSLTALEKNFFINRYYLSKIFKKCIGNNIHEYIIYKRISRAKKLLHEGKNVTEACTGSGFKDYSNFLRIFKRTVGTTPGKYVNRFH